ncbi:MAG: alpha/beta hydrolase [Kiritimatiellae bacterium]|nr:alpha/beta hydrolase [Kiritimatiellia bacterium]
MHIETFGAGDRDIVALHGWGGDHRQFAPLAARLPPGWRLWSADLPGYGRSPRPVVWTATAIVDELVADLRRLGVGPARWIGFCSGAILALLAAQRCPALVERLFLIDPFAYVPWYFRLFLWGAPGAAAYHVSFATAAGRRIVTAVLRRLQSSDDDFLTAFEGLDHDATLHWLRMLRELEPVERFSDLRLPITVAVGEHTFGAVRRSVGRFQQMWPQVHVRPLRGVGHLPLVRGARQLAALAVEA